MFGRLKAVVARKLESKKQVIESASPSAISKIIPEMKILLTSSALPSARY